MKHTDVLYAAHVTCCAKNINQPLSHTDIIELQDIFLTPGFHTIKFSHIHEGRLAIDAILTSLNCYQNAACLTMQNEPILQPEFFDIYYALTLGGYFQGNFENSLDMFFLEQFDTDFLWIESTQELIEQPWFYMFERKLDEYNVGHTVPIITMTTE